MKANFFEGLLSTLVSPLVYMLPQKMQFASPKIAQITKYPLVQGVEKNVFARLQLTNAKEACYNNRVGRGGTAAFFVDNYGIIKEKRRKNLWTFPFLK